MKHPSTSIRAFIGAKDFEVSKSFYRDLGFEESVVSSSMSYFSVHENMGFYLQDAYVKDWVDNSMLFLEVNDIDQHWNELSGLALQGKYPGVRISGIKTDTWGREYFLHDPSGILWHFGVFNK
ncbi:MAG: glyoxalase [Sphingobacteriales bacterium]|nr:MAG: glyoxalase [Sphingobacteriales bacterium]